MRHCIWQRIPAEITSNLKETFNPRAFVFDPLYERGLNMIDRTHIQFGRGRSFFGRCLRRAAIGALLLSIVAGVCLASASDTEPPLPADLTELSLEDLMDIEITSVAKKAQKLSEAAAAVFVITQEDIRRSGATSIPEALRMAPGLEVARIDANKWAVTSRGFNGRFANKLLVLIDGRTVYTPLYSGVYWDMKDTLLEDIDRIEVIRGPGASLWGANAVNGVINIITKSAKDTQGGLIVAGAGTEEQGFGAVRYGGKLGQDIDSRAYVKYFDRDSGVFSSGENGADQWDILRAGFRMDWQRSGPDALTLEGDIYDGEAGVTVVTKSFDPYAPPTLDEDDSISGANLLCRWKHSVSDSSEVALQVYYDRTERNGVVLDQIHDTFDLDLQQQFAPGKRHEIVWGLGYRFVSDDIRNTFYGSWDPDSRDDDLFSGFVQDDITLIKNRLRLTLGSKFEHNDYTGSEIQPNGRLMWTPHDGHSIWTAVSRAVRTPSRTEEDGRLNTTVLAPGSLLPLFPGYGVVSLFGDGDYESEELLAYELGYRAQPTDQFSVDIAAFFNDYSNLRTLEPGNPFLEVSPSPAHLVFPFTVGNKMDGETYGVEVAADWRASDWWRIQASYTYLQIQLDLDRDSGDTLSESAEGDSPHHQVSLRSSMDIVSDLALDLWVRYVDDLPSQDVDSYITLDVRLGWKLHEDVELSVIGQNLLDDHHPEYKPEFIDTIPTEVQRSVYGKVTWQF
jgi:iron complex outermembrane receptor protein